jgi:hypothetical protein
MPLFEDLPFNVRPDLTPYLLHLTKRRGERTAFQNLINILKGGTLTASTTQEGFIRGPHPATCFMDIPFSALKYILTDQNCRCDPPKYEPYGVFFMKITAYQLNLRPVLYLSNDEVDELSIQRDQEWRVVRLEARDDEWINWMHEREWRVKGNVELPETLIGALVQKPSEAVELYRMIHENPNEFHCRPKTILPLSVVCQGLKYLSPEPAASADRSDNTPVG